MPLFILITNTICDAILLISITASNELGVS